MFQSISGHSSEQSTAHNSSRPIVSQLKMCIQHRGHKFPPSPTLHSVQNSNRVASRLHWLQSQVFRAYFSTPAIFKATSKLFGTLGCSDDNNWLDFSSIFFKNCIFRGSIPPSTVKFDSCVIVLDQSQFFVTHSNQWDGFILYRSWLFPRSPKWAKVGFRWKILK